MWSRPEPEVAPCEPCKYCEKRYVPAKYMVQDKWFDVYVCGKHLTKAVGVWSDDHVKVWQVT